MFRFQDFRICMIIQLAIIVLMAGSCRQAETGKEAEDTEGFVFAFVTDIHVQPERNATEGFRQAIRKVNELDPDFVITGGDLIMDALGVTYERADSLYDLYEETVQEFDMPVYNTIGNHEVFGYYEESGVDSTHPFYGDKLYESRMGKRYYAFNYKNWRFYILDSVEEMPGGGGYYGYVDREQIEWLKEDLQDVDTETPLAISVHIPMITVQTQLVHGTTVPNNQGSVITNANQVLELFEGHNLKLVLQGHLHAYEEIYANGIYFITGGAVCARWWQGPRRGMEEGFLMVDVNDQKIDAEYIDFGWTVEE